MCVRAYGGCVRVNSEVCRTYASVRTYFRCMPCMLRPSNSAHTAGVQTHVHAICLSLVIGSR